MKLLLLIQLIFALGIVQNLIRRWSNVVSCVMSRKRILAFLGSMALFYLVIFLIRPSRVWHQTAFLLWLYLASCFLSTGMGKKGVHYVTSRGFFVKLMAWEEIDSIHLVENDQGVLMININGKKEERTQQYPAWRAEHVLKLAEANTLLIL